jgi:hypothetical protein
MSEQTKFRVYLGIAAVLYVWGLGALWVAHDWGLSEFQYLFVAILPVLGGVLSMSMALISYIGLIEEDEDGSTGRKEEQEPAREAESGV